MVSVKARSGRRIGVMGGTFDPIHVGHLLAASEVAARMNLDSVIFVPAGEPWQKAGRQISAAEHRYAMTLIATANDPRFTTSRVDIDRAGPTYTCDTLRDLREELRDAGCTDTEWFFIAGVDALEDAGTWHSIEDVMRMATLVVVPRPGTSASPSDALGGRYDLIDIPGVAVSSTDCRERAREGRSLAYLVPAAVDTYIAKTGLYTGGDA